MTLEQSTNADTVALASLVLGADCAIVAQSIRENSEPVLPALAFDSAIKQLLHAKLITRCGKDKPFALVTYAIADVKRRLGARAAALVCTPL